MHSKVKGLIWLIAIIVFSASFALAIPLLARMLPWSVEERLAKHLGGVSSLSCLSKDSSAQKILQKTLKRIYPLDSDEKNLPPITVDIIDDPNVNAVAMLGRRIYVFRGLLEKAESPDELAGVLAHEIEHIRHRHVIEAVMDRIVIHGSIFVLLGGHQGADTLSWFMDLKFSREMESEADRDGLKRLRAAKVSSQGILDFFNRLQKESDVPAIISDHPSSADRATWIKQMGTYPSEPVLTSSEWRILKTSCHAR